MPERIDSPSQLNAEQSSSQVGAELAENGIEWTDDGEIVVRRLAWMTDEQWHRMSTQMQIWWNDYREQLGAQLAARQAMQACPAAPPCPPWCCVKHEDRHKGWETFEQHNDQLIPDSVQKDCYASLGHADCDDGGIDVRLHRMTCVDFLGARWDGLYVGDETVELHPDDEFSRLDGLQLETFRGLLRLGADAIAASAAMASESVS